MRRCRGGPELAADRRGWGGRRVRDYSWSEPVQRLAQAGFGFVAEAFERGLEQRGEDAGWAFEGELGSVGHLGSGRHGPEGQGVNGDDGLVLPAEPDALTGDELTHDEIGRASCRERL